MKQSVGTDSQTLIHQVESALNLKHIVKSLHAYSAILVRLTYMIHFGIFLNPSSLVSW